MSVEELTQILKIAPSTASIQVCGAITKFWHENPEEYRRVKEYLELVDHRRSIEELKGILKIIPIDIFMLTKICGSIDSFWCENPEDLQEVHKIIWGFASLPITLCISFDRFWEDSPKEYLEVSKNFTHNYWWCSLP